MSEYQKEKRKVLILLGVGILLIIAFAIYGKLSIRDFFAGPEEILIFIGLLCYPIGIVYGWREIFGFYHNMRKGDRLTHGGLDHVGYNSLMITAVWMGLAIAITFLFGWIFGTWKAVKRLRALKNNA